MRRLVKTGRKAPTQPKTGELAVIKAWPTHMTLVTSDDYHDFFEVDFNPHVDTIMACSVNQRLIDVSEYSGATSELFNGFLDVGGKLRAYFEGRELDNLDMSDAMQIAIAREQINYRASTVRYYPNKKQRQDERYAILK